jgi:hypothetical protein
LRPRDERRSRSFYQIPRFADDEKPKLQHRTFSPRLKTTVFQQNRPVAADHDEPQNGLLVCTSQEHHVALIEEMPAFRLHPVLENC